MKLFSSIFLSKKTFVPFLLVLSVLSVVLRLWMSAQVIETDPFTYAPPAITDMASYQMISDEIMKGKIPTEFVYQPFYYSVFLPVVKFLTGSRVWGPAIGQSICAGLIVWFVGLCGAMLRGRIHGRIAALFAAFSTMLFFYVPYALIEIQQCLWFTLIFYFVLRGMRTNRIRYWAVTGLFLSFAILSRGNAWCFLPPILLALLFTKKKFKTSWSGMSLRAGMLLMLIILPQLPFVCVNSYSQGSWSGPSLAGPTVLALGNNPEAAPGSLIYPKTYSEWMIPGERSAVRRIVDWAISEPAAFLELQIKKFFLFFEHVEISNNIALAVNAKESWIFHVFGFIPTGLIVGLFLAGFFLCLPELYYKKADLILVLFILFYALATAAFYILARFRVPALGLFCIGTVLFPGDLLMRLRRKDYRYLVFHQGVAALLAILIVGFLGANYRTNYEASVMRLIRPNGVSLACHDGTFDMLDNGPNYLESWVPVQIKNGTVFEKRFANLPELKQYKKCSLTLSLLTFSREAFQVEINGVHDSVLIGMHLNARGWELANVGTFDVPVPEDGVFRIRFFDVRPEAPLYLYADLFRDYGRTALDGKPLYAEAAIRLTLKDKRK